MRVIAMPPPCLLVVCNTFHGGFGVSKYTI